MFCTEAIRQLQRLLVKHGDQQVVTAEFCPVKEIKFYEFGPAALDVDEAERLANDPSTPKKKLFCIEPVNGD